MLKTKIPKFTEKSDQESLVQQCHQVNDKWICHQCFLCNGSLHSSGIIDAWQLLNLSPCRKGDTFFKWKQVFLVAVWQCWLRRKTDSDVIARGAKGEDHCSSCSSSVAVDNAISFLMRCSLDAVQNMQLFCGEVQCAYRPFAVRSQCSKSVPAATLLSKFQC